MRTPAEVIPSDWAHWSHSAPTVVKPLSNGLTNRSYQILADGTLLVLRRNSPASSQLDLNRMAEAQALRLADRAGLCAPVVYCDPQQRYLVTRFIQGTPIDANQSPDREKLAALVREIHRQPTIAVALEIEEKISRYRRAIAPHATFAGALASLHRKIEPHMAAAARLSDGMVLCHNDLQENNLIAGLDGRLYAIDWEYAASGDAYFDLAVITEEFDWDTSGRENFLANYLQRVPGERELQRLQHWQHIYRYLALLWYAVQNCHRDLTGAPDRSDSIHREAEALLRRLY
ncbi:phosphotransferase [Microbulbifer sp. SH-1]|uniref:choline/ethanolamine kinase family protein n=1 Tax=Microbulbifer sp. SH-1 TaxID=2681547 RepID=UPI00140D82EA|nr:choline/ethanolamine kinase family protein [Microbulbifer sp. SH-1]QIL91695.1 phosphotransferase [Microbulbifer sp. SH-1]